MNKAMNYYCLVKDILTVTSMVTGTPCSITGSITSNSNFKVVELICVTITACCWPP